MLYPEASEAVVAIAPVVAGAVGKAYVLVPKQILILLQNAQSWRLVKSENEEQCKHRCLKILLNHFAIHG